MNSDSRAKGSGALRLFHLAENPNDSYLLQQELQDQGFDPEIERIGDSAALQAALQRADREVIVVDLPLPEDLPVAVIDEMLAERPGLRLVFRWGDTGERITESSSSQLGRRIRDALRGAGSPAESCDRKVMTEAVRYQRAFLELSRLDLWDFQAALHRITETMARLMGVERVSVWEFDEQRALRCLDLHIASTRAHGKGPDLSSYRTYLESLERSLTVATDDPVHDPRTSALVDYLKPLGITAMLDAPVRQGGRVVGVVCHEHVGPPRAAWTLLEQCAASKVAGLVGRAFEVRQRRQMQERFAELECLDAIGDVARGLAHDMNNVLMVLLDGLRELRTSPAQSSMDVLHSTTAAAESMRGMVLSLGAIGRSEQLELERLELRSWTAGHAALLRGTIGNRGSLRFAFEVDRVLVRADARALSRVLVNLVKNAAESQPDDREILVRVGARSLPSAAELPAGQYAVVEVRDHGPGMSEAEVRQLFRPYFSTKQHGGERGLGLATAYGLMRQHGGTIHVESWPGDGSCFQLLLPIVPSSPAE